MRALKLPNFIVNSNFSDCMHFLGYFVLHDVNKNSYLAKFIGQRIDGTHHSPVQIAWTQFYIKIQSWNWKPPLIFGDYEEEYKWFFFCFCTTENFVWLFSKNNWSHCLYGKINSGNKQPEGILDIKLQLQQIIILSFNFKCSGHCLKDLKCLYNLYNQKKSKTLLLKLDTGLRTWWWFFKC